MDFYKKDARPYTHELPLKIVLFDEGPWTHGELKSNIEEAARIYGQCGVKLKVKKIENDKGNGSLYFDLEGYTDPNEKREEASALDYGKKYSSSNEVTVFLMDSFDSFYNNIRATAVPIERVKYPGQEDALNSVWISYQSQVVRSWSRIEGGFPSGYNDLAHELGHILLDTSHVEGNHIHNLMHESYSNLNGHLTLEQCQEIRSSDLLTKLPTSPDLVCPEITSPLRGAINFIDPSDTNCEVIAEVVTTLDNMRNNVSDLTYLGGIDFIMEKRSDLIQYSDKNYFESSSEITFDESGTDLLRKDQSDILWMHELGHAIFNAKLEEDWSWYRGRLNIMKEWGRLVRESFGPDVDERQNTERVNEQINLLVNYPNNFELEDILAPYHELFADALVVIYTRDPEIIKKGLAHPTRPDQNMDQERDFSLNHSYEQWHESEAHALLSPVRSHIWKLISKINPEQRTNQEIVRTLYIALRDEILERSENRELWNLTVPEINKRLIRKLNWL